MTVASGLVRSNVQDDRPHLELTGFRRAVAIFAVLSAMALVVLDAGIVNIALPTIAAGLHASPARVVMVITAYQAGLVMALLPCGALGERFGYRRMFTAGVAVFAAASAFSALAPTLFWLVAARFVQGLGGAAVMALGVALLRASVPSGRLGAAIGWNALTVALASAVAPSLGAAILSVSAWPWLFTVNLPLAALGLLAARALPPTPGRAGALDLVSMALNATAFAFMILAAELAPRTPLAAFVFLVAAVISLLALVRREALKQEPMIPLDLMRRRSFRLSVIASTACFAGQAAGLLALPFYLQHGLRQTPLTAGLYITAWPLAVAVTAMVAGRLADRISTAWLCAIGAAGLSVGLAAAAIWPLADDPRRVVPFVILCGAGFGLFQAPNNRNMFLAAPARRSGAVGGMQGTARVAGQTLGALMMTMLFGLTSTETAPRIALALAAVLALAAGLTSLLRTAQA